MTDYTKLVEALRYCAESGDFNCNKDCPMYPNYPRCLTKMDMDAADAIEALQAQLPKRGEWIVFNKQMLINLENAREQYKELGYPHRTELGLQCSNCRKVTYVDSGIKYEFCPHCGAKMEVQDG